jgi:hypothetical protein
MLDGLIEILAARIAAVPIRRDPFAHIYVEEIFPDEVFERLRAELPGEEAYVRLKDSGRVGPDYSEQRLAFAPAQLPALAASGRQFWTQVFDALLAPEVTRTIFAKFAADLKLAADGGDMRIATETCLMRDRAGYELGPHTDSPAKLVSLLFYLAPDTEHPELGTSFYVPKDRTFFCPGGPHHPFELFDRVATLPYAPNSLLAFPKTERCFHGVEPLDDPTLVRDLLFVDLRRT